MKLFNKNNTPESIYSTYVKRYAVRALIIKDQKILLIHSRKYNSYTLPGGGVEKDESLEQAVIREVMEETGLSIKVEQIIGETTEVFDERGILNITTAFLCEVIDEYSQDLDPNSVEEGQEIIWVSPNEAIELIEGANSDSQHSAMLRDAYLIGEYLLLT